LAVTIPQVTSALKQKGLKFGQPDETTILMGFGSAKDSIKVILRVLENGEYIDMRTLLLATCADDNSNLESLQAELLQQNLDYKMVKFCRDTEDGEIAARVCLPLEDNPSITADQLSTLIGALVSRCNEVLPTINKLIEAGKRPGKKKTIEKGGGTTPPEGKSRTSTILAIGVLMLGAAAILAVVYLFLFMHKG
jgi:hypothetical protein